MRNARSSMVQTVDQYKFIYDFIFEKIYKVELEKKGKPGRYTL